MKPQSLHRSLVAARRDAFHNVPICVEENRDTPKRGRTWPSTAVIAALTILLLGADRAAAADGYNTHIDDSLDLYPGNAAGVGLPSWRVSEPFMNLWIQDAVVRYKTSAGKTVNLDIAYRQRGATDTSDSFGFGPGWQCGWFSRVAYETAELDGGFFEFEGVFDFVPPMGGSLAYSADGQTPEYHTYSTMTAGHGEKCGANIDVTYPDGTQCHYNFNVRCTTNFLPTDGEWTNYLSSMQDPQGRTVVFHYTTNEGTWSIAGIGNVLLTSVVDYDNRTNLFFYDSVFTNQISAIVDPYLRTNTFQYDGSGRLTNIMNPIGMSFRVVYDDQGVITNMITPYGTNVFRWQANTNTGNVVSRSIQVTEADGRQHLFAYR